MNVLQSASMGMPLHDLTGEIFGRITVLRRATKIGYIPVRWLCQCECGNLTIAEAGRMKSGKCRSCGCLAGETKSVLSQYPRRRLKQKRSTEKATTEYRTWHRIRERCHNPKYPKYHLYGERGIVVCHEWLNSYESFLAHIGRKPTPKHSIDRIDTNKGYEPGNVRWATSAQQNRNRRNTRKVIDETGSLVPLVDLCSQHGVASNRVWYHVKLGRDPLEVIARTKAAAGGTGYFKDLPIAGCS